MRKDLHLRALLGVEFHRAPSALLRGLSPIALMLVILLAAHKDAATIFAFVTLMSLGISAMVVPMLIFQDRQRGTLEFLCALPTNGRTLAAARFLAVACITLPWSILTIPTVLLATRASTVNGSGLLIGTLAMFGSWLVACLIGWVAVALLARFEMTTALLIPFTVFIVGITIAQYLFPSALAQLSRGVRVNSLMMPAVLKVIGGGSLLLGIGVTVVAFEATAHRFATYEPDPTAG